MSEGHAYDWDTEYIETPNEGGGGYTLLPPGEYPFRVTAFERGEYGGSAKIPACKQAILTLEIDGGQHGTATVKENLQLHSAIEWKLCSFFTCVGDRKSGEPLKMDWRNVIGKRGMLKLKHRNGKGEKAANVYNDVDAFIDPAKVKPTAAEAPADQQGFDWASGQQATPSWE